MGIRLWCVSCAVRWHGASCSRHVLFGTVHLCETDCDGFSGLSGSVNGRPYLVVNEQMSPERNRSTLAHELAHVMFRWPVDDDHGNIEKQATAISGAFLFPIRYARRELGLRRCRISSDMQLVLRNMGFRCICW